MLRIAYYQRIWLTALPCTALLDALRGCNHACGPYACLLLALTRLLVHTCDRYDIHTQ
jgi:hypothetical protein